MSGVWRWIAAAALIVAAGAGGWFGYRALYGRAPTPARVEQVVPTPASDPGIETIDVAEGSTTTNGGTPMAERVTVLGLLNKRNGESRDLTMRPGQAKRFGDVVVRLRACERTAPWEEEQLTGAFAQVIVRGPDRTWRRAFSGWLFKERPALNVVQHPVYDVWVKSCTMSFPETGPDTETLSAPSAPARRSSARQSAGEDAPAAEPSPSDESAAPSNAI